MTRKSDQPSLELLVQMRNGQTWRHVQSLLERGEMFKWPHHHLPLLIRNLAFEEHPKLGWYPVDTLLFSKRDSVSLLEHFSSYREGKTEQLGN